MTSSEAQHRSSTPLAVTFGGGAIIGLLIGYLILFPFAVGAIISIGTVSIVGAFGGILYAIRESELVVPSFNSEKGIRLGWIADCTYGIAGGFLIFLVMPGMSENLNDFKLLPMITGSQANNETNPPGENAELDSTQAAGDNDRGKIEDGDKTTVDWIEVIAVALVGGYAGRALMKQAANSLANVRKEVQETRREIDAEIQARAGEITSQLEEYRQNVEIDSETLSLIERQLDPELGSPPRDKLSERIKQSSYTIKARAFFRARQALQRNPDRAALIKPIVLALVEADEEERYHQSRYLLAKIFAALQDWVHAREWVNKAIYIRDHQQAEGFRFYELLQARSEIELCPSFAEGQRSSEDIREPVLGMLRAPLEEGQDLDSIDDETLRRWIDLNHPSPAT